MYTNIDGTFAADNVEEYNLKGDYRIEAFYNNHPNLESLDEVPSYHAKAVFYKGNVLYKADEPKILDYIQLMIKYTYTEPEIKIERNKTQMAWGTICPTSEDIYEIDDKLFTIIGRYIYGYNDFKKVTFSSKTSKKKIYLKRASDDPKNHVVYPFLNDYNYSFKIVDKTTKVLYAFGLYR